MPVPLGDPQISNPLVDRPGRLWVASPTHPIEWNQGSQRVWTAKDGLPAGAVDALFEDSSGRLWIGTTHGLAVLDRHA